MAWLPPSCRARSPRSPQGDPPQRAQIQRGGSRPHRLERPYHRGAGYAFSAFYLGDPGLPHSHEFSQLFLREPPFPARLPDGLPYRPPLNAFLELFPLRSPPDPKSLVQHFFVRVEFHVAACLRLSSK